jgi:hypothetical protein
MAVADDHLMCAAQQCSEMCSKLTAQHACWCIASMGMWSGTVPVMSDGLAPNECCAAYASLELRVVTARLLWRCTVSAHSCAC